MIKYENGAIIVSKDSALEELRKFAVDFGEMVMDKSDGESGKVFLRTYKGRC